MTSFTGGSNWAHITYQNNCVPQMGVTVDWGGRPQPMIQGGCSSGPMYQPFQYELPEVGPLYGEQLDEAVQKILGEPDHMWNPFEGGSYCQDCPAGGFFMDEPARHPYFIKEWEIG